MHSGGMNITRRTIPTVLAIAVLLTAAWYGPSANAATTTTTPSYTRCPGINSHFVTTHAWPLKLGPLGRDVVGTNHVADDMHIVPGYAGVTFHTSYADFKPGLLSTAGNSSFNPLAKSFYMGYHFYLNEYPHGYNLAQFGTSDGANGDSFIKPLPGYSRVTGSLGTVRVTGTYPYPVPEHQWHWLCLERVGNVWTQLYDGRAIGTITQDIGVIDLSKNLNYFSIGGKRLGGGAITDDQDLCTCYISDVQVGDATK